MPISLQNILAKFTKEVQNVYGNHLKTIILYGSYARGDFSVDSDIDIMILLDIDEMEIKKYRHKLSEITFDYNMDYDIDIKPIAKSEALFEKWLENYPFYSNVKKEGVTIYHAA